MDSVARFEVGQAVYITNARRDFAWPALVGELIAPNYVTLVFNNNECALVEARYIAAFPPVTLDNFDRNIEPLPDAFFDTSHRTLPTQVPGDHASALNELCDDPDAIQRELAAEAEEECSDAPMIREPAYAKVTIMQMPSQYPPSKRASRRKRISSKLTLHNRYHQRIEPVKQKRCCSIQ